MAALQGGSVRRWGPIEVVWTAVVVTLLLAGLAAAVAVGGWQADQARSYVPIEEVGQADSWRPLDIGRLRTVVPGIAERPSEDALGRTPFPVEARSVRGVNGNRVVVARIEAPAPPDGATARLYAIGAAELSTIFLRSTPPRRRRSSPRRPVATTRECSRRPRCSTTR